MGLGAGHVLDMINRMKQNRAQRPSNRSKFKENNRDGIYSSDKKSRQPNFKTVPEKELIEIKNRIRERAKTEQKKERIIIGISILFGIISLIGFLI
ncbi:hypothetical protein DUT90_00030 [Polaribacter sp. WD7]|uniref:hypothetical protein n=1 Tax=Polaribacter sp. WD7 TaxID=2269061 RepID=UPI000DF14492|nr:hypothetical protein [Polaribacter sp. WD7]RCS28534.1 hypothetical protein DUT90_00030 [Polaribacter sp. WD7]